MSGHKCPLDFFKENVRILFVDIVYSIFLVTYELQQKQKIQKMLQQSANLHKTTSSSPLAQYLTSN